MIQEIKAQNFKSFKDEIILSFEATRDEMFEDYQVVEVAPGMRLLRFALVYGANASGKSNLLEIIDFLRMFWFNKPDDMDESTGTIPFKLDRETPNQPSRFEIKFYVDAIRYWYILELDERRVYTEKLYYYKSVQPTLLFSREWKEGKSVININATILKVSKAAQEEISLRCLPNMSFFAARNQVNLAIPEIDAAKDWMREKILPNITPDTQMFIYASERMAKDARLRDYMLDFVHRADFNITGVKSNIIKEQLSPELVNYLMTNENIPASEKDRLLKDQSYETVETSFEHTVHNERGEEKYVLPTELQSDGTRRTIGVEAAIYSALEKEAFLHIDEVEASLHPELVEFILQRFLSTKNRSQLLVTTHYDPLLNTADDLIRRDSVWFTDKKESGATIVYSLVEFKGLKRIASLQKAYRNGLFGALPNIKG
jgi:AAA15 family ATPase/GTPase